jgi:hypothetical protein
MSQHRIPENIPVWSTTLSGIPNGNSTVHRTDEQKVQEQHCTGGSWGVAIGHGSRNFWAPNSYFGVQTVHV